MQSIKLHPGQKAVVKSPAKYRVLCCGRQFGKTTLSVLELIACAYAGKDRRVAYFAPNYRDARDIAWKFLKAQTQPIWNKRPNESRLELDLRTQDDGISTVYLRGFESVDSSRGQQYDLIVLDEVAQYRNFNEGWKAVLLPTLAKRNGEVLFTSTPRGYNHFYELFQLGTGDSDLYESFHYTSYDNPHLSHDVIDEAKRVSTPEWFAQEWMAEFTTHTGLVFKGFHRGDHVKELKDFRPVMTIGGLDRGWRSPTAFTHVEVDSDGVWYQTDEIYLTHIQNPQLVEILTEQFVMDKMELQVMDSANASDMAELNELGNFSFLPAKKEAGEGGTQYVQHKIQKFSQKLLKGPDGRFGYYVHPRCVNTVHEFETYRYPEQRSEMNPQEKPIKFNDHALDALMDLNVVYIHDFEEEVKKPWHGKQKGTYVPAYEEVLEEKYGFAKGGDTYDTWDQPL